MTTQPPDLYFAFPDGSLEYVCAECTALCCKGFGFGGSLERHVRSLFVLHPPLEATIVSRNADIVELSTPPDGCHFLEPDNHCGIEKKHGKAAKPGVCTLFPFNMLRRLGPAIVVGPHFLCPLRIVVPAASGAVEGTHARLVSAVADSGLLGLDGRGAHLPSVPVRPGAGFRDVLRQEAGFRNACAAALGLQRFRDVVRSASEDTRAFEASVRRILDIAGLPQLEESADHDQLDDVLLAVAPALRLEYLRLSPEGVLRALAMTEALVRLEARLSDRMNSPQVTHRSATARRPAVQLLAHGDEPLQLKRSLSPKAPTISDPHLTFSAFLATRALSTGTGVASALESALQPAMTTADRITLAMTLGSRVDPLLSRRRDGAT